MWYDFFNFLFYSTLARLLDDEKSSSVCTYLYTNHVSDEQKLLARIRQDGSSVSRMNSTNVLCINKQKDKLPVSVSVKEG